jgi:hypothetical protein
MRETRSSGSVEGVMSNHAPYSDFLRHFASGKTTGDEKIYWGSSCEKMQNVPPRDSTAAGRNEKGEPLV